MVVATVVDWMFLLIPDEIMLGWLLLAPLLGTLLGGPLLALHVGWLASPVESGWLQPVFGANTLTVHLPTVLVAMMWPVVALVFLTVLWWPGHRIFLAFVPGWQAADTSAMLRTQMLFSGGILATLLIAVAAASTGNPLAVGWAYAALQSAWGAILGWGLLAVISIGGTAMFKRYAMGLGDVKLLAPLGALVGPIGVVMVFALAVLLASCLGVVHLLRGGGREMPFGPSLAIAGMVVLLWGAEMLQLVLG
jgi:prepilin signal peptidase PulO-like enzyme (type II secretory pathway)